MFDIGATELLVIVIVAVIAIGPKDMPLALRTAGRWIGKIRRMSAHFRTGVDAMIREAEMEEMEKTWRERNAAIMAQHPAAEMVPDDGAAPPPASAEAAVPPPEAPAPDKPGQG
ncbi:MAG: Sec-independent protein translocase protein TatB [Sphingomonadaceae bacterium]